jgi:hypothetical protein
MVNRCSRWKDLEASTTGSVPCLGAFVVLVFAASIGTSVEGKIGRYTAEWTLENQGHPHDSQKQERCQWSGCSGLEKALVTAESGSRLPSCNAAQRGLLARWLGRCGVSPQNGENETTASSLARSRGKSFPRPEKALAVASAISEINIILTQLTHESSR